ncbi:serpin family protein [Margalitia sp. FSL K6-0131]|uniref:serpin family protein n=1 Tax=Margalitia sp. FSL K6-0131 TaxID=2954604 RepID=UPI0030F8A1F5
MKKLVYPLLIACFLLILPGCGTKKEADGLEISSNVEFGKEDYQRIVSSQNELGFDWLQHVVADKNENVIISPASLFMALSMAYNGADGVTKDEIAKVLHVGGLNNSELNKANASLMSMLHNNSEKVQLNVANSIWLNNNYHFQDDFSKNNKDYFNAKIQEIDIKNPNAPDKINGWVKKATNNNIKDLVDAPLSSDLITILINAVYFKGNWQYEFDKKHTEKKTFHLKDGATKKVPLMKLNKELDYLETEDFQAVALPYGDGETSMVVFLPKENTRLDEFQKKLNADNWKQWQAQFMPRQGTFMLPKFKFEHEIELNDTLEKLGMKSAFTSDANFSKMVKETIPIQISEVKQKTFIDVNEKGTEAAAATSVTMTKASVPSGEPFQMEVNRPFFFAIVDNNTTAILFMGAISDPTEAK